MSEERRGEESKQASKATSAFAFSRNNDQAMCILLYFSICDDSIKQPVNYIPMHLPFINSYI
jgi:hypothetical protein